MQRILEIPYKPRPQFKAYHENQKRFAISVCHRRAGKTVARVNHLLREAVRNPRLEPHPRYGFLAPYFNQSKEIAWTYLKHYASPLIQEGAKPNESELSLTLPHNGAVIRLYGAENAERMRGLYFDGLAADEAQGISRSVLSEIVLPCLSDFKGWLHCSGTPKGWANLLGELYRIAQKHPEDWYLQVLRASETGLISPDELKHLKSFMSDNEYEQEMECSFDAAITGAVYGKQIADADKEGRILKDLPIANGVPVNTAWDLGLDDATAIWWYQVLRDEIRFLDYYENAGENIEHYCAVVTDRGKERGFTYGKHFAPHDAAHKLLAAGGRSIVQQAEALGIRMYVVAATSQQNAIEALRKTLERAWFDAGKCERGLEALRQYQFEFDPDLKAFRSKPRHDWASHGADAAEIVGQVWRKPEEIKEPAKPKFLSDMTFDELIKSTPKRNEHRI